MAGLLPLLLLLLLAAAPANAQQGFLSIDCGASQPYTDANGIRWVGDGAYVRGGEVHTAAARTPGGAVSRELTTLRAFPSGKKNCYTIPVRDGEQVLLRAAFYYGNYDGKASPPAFDVMFDGNLWKSVEITTAEDVVSYEAVYVARGKSTSSVCFARSKPGGVPFVSSIEVRTLRQSMYPNFSSDRWLLLWDRVAYAADKDVLRYPDDPYDRIWTSQSAGTGVSVLRNETAVVVGDGVTDDPPAAVFEAAIATNSSSRSLVLKTTLPPESKEVNINFYFTEMLQLDLGVLPRTLELAMDNNGLTSDPLTVPRRAVVEFSVFNATANGSTTFTVQTASGYTLPPLVNAMESFTVEDELRVTDGRDVQGLARLKQLWPALGSWTGDPCLPTPYNWEWVACSSGATPRITALYLGGFGLTGEFPQFISETLSALETIDLHNNRLTGSVPASLGDLRNLKDLNLADNNFNGSVPSSLSQKNNLKLDISGNPGLQCSGGSCSGGKKNNKSNTGLIVGITVPLVVVLCVAVGLTVYCLRRKKTAVAVAGGVGKPSSPPGGVTPPVPAAGAPPATNDYRIEIEWQMGTELADLMAQQAAQQRHYEPAGPETAPETARQA